MKKIFFIFSFLLVPLIYAIAQVSVRGYYRKDGTYVSPHYRSNPDGNPYNNWSFPGNTNPYTGKKAAGNPDTYLKNYYNDGSNNQSYSIPSNGNLNSTNSTNSYQSTTYDIIKNSNIPIFYLDNEKVDNKSIRTNENSHKTEELFYELYENQSIISYHDKYTWENILLFEKIFTKIGYYVGDIDGFFDEKTIMGVKKFQKDNDLTPDGRLGTQSIKKLESIIRQINTNSNHVNNK